MQRIGLGKSDVGKVRSNNEDAIFVCNEGIGTLPNLYIVADGMGGHNAGEVASSKSIEFFKEYVLRHEASNCVKSEIEDIIKNATLISNESVYNMSVGNSDQNGMGTTFSVCVIYDGELFFGHVGDSRIYIVSKNDIRAVTNDHTYVNEMVISGDLTQEQARNHPKRNMLTRALGTEKTVMIDEASLRLSDDETVIICSDGLTNMVSESDIYQIVNDSADNAGILDALIGLANERGGFDNISVIII